MMKNTFHGGIIYYFFIVLAAIAVFETQAQSEETGNQNDKAVIYPQLGHRYSVSTVAFSPDGRLALSGGDSVRMWDVHSGREYNAFSANESSAFVDFTPDGAKVVSLTPGGKILVWDASSGKQLRTINSGTDNYAVGTLSKDGGFILAGGIYGALELWSLNEDKEVMKLQLSKFGESNISINAVAISPDNQYAFSGGDGGDLTLWDLKKGKEIHFVQSGLSSIDSLNFTSDGKRIIVTGYYSDYYYIMVLDASSMKRISLSEAQYCRMKAVSVSMDGKHLLVGSDDGSIKQYNPDDGKLEKELQSDQYDEEGQRKYGLWRKEFSDNPILYCGQFLSVKSLKYSRDGKTALSGNHDGSLTLWDVASGKKMRTFKGNSNNNTAITISSDNKLMAVGDDKGFIRFWDIPGAAKNKLSIKLEGRYEPNAKTMAFSPETKLLAVSSDQLTLDIFNTDNGSKRLAFEGSRYAAYSPPCFSPDGKTLLVGYDNESVKIWNMQTGAAIKDIKAFADSEFDSIHTVLFNADGKNILSSKSNGMKIFDTDSGSELLELNTRHACPLALSTDGSKALGGICDNISGYADGTNESTLKLLDLKTGSEIFKFKESQSFITSLSFLPGDGQAVTVTDTGLIQFWDTQNGAHIKTIETHISVVSSFISKNAYKAYIVSKDGSVRIWDLKTGQETVQFVSFKNDEWIVVTPEGFFAASPDGAENLNVRVGDDVFAIDQVYQSFYRPDLVIEKLNGDPEGMVRAAAEKLDIRAILSGGQAPLAEFISPTETNISELDVNVKVQLADQGGGFGKVEWKVNGVTVGLEGESRGGGFSSVAGSGKERIISRKLSLTPGKNTVEVVAWNARNEVAGLPAYLELNCEAGKQAKPSLYILAVGINRYFDRALWLQYAVPDVESITSEINKSGTSIYAKVEVYKILDTEATSSGIETAFNKLSVQMQPQDAFVFYLSGHGMTLDGRYYFLPYDFRYRNEESVRSDGVTQDRLQTWLAMIPARNSLVLLDTCASGSMAIGNKAVMRGIEEKAAIDKLSRAIGRSTIAAAMDTQPALEGYKGHGVFTYVFMDALKNADSSNGNKDGMTTIFELGAYIDELVPKVTQEEFNFAQIPQMNLQGNFPLGMIE